MINKILSTAFMVTGYGAFFILALDLETYHQKTWYAFIIPFLILLAVLIFLWAVSLWS